MKEHMKRMFITLMMSMLMSVSLLAQVQDMPCVEVVGYASIEVEPNEIWVRITIDERESNSKIKLEELERKMLSILKGAGVDTKEALFVNGFSGVTHKRNSGALCKNYSLRLNSAAKVGEVFDKLQEAGINRLAVTSTGRSDVAELKSRLRVESVQNALSRAMELAGAVGQEVGMAIYINDYNVDSSPTLYRAKAVSFAMDNSIVEENYDSPEFSNIKLDYRVTVKFELLQVRSEQLGVRSE
ncbi:MAG: SIMPL domain-containing protein [Marinifilaceae bacterium]|nr:SIMPL domain-containing protein [Marinifilaceae bacterium]